MSDERRVNTGVSPVFVMSAGLVALVTLFFLLYGGNASGALVDLRNQAAHLAGWFVILVMNIALGLMVWLAFSRFGALRIGGQDAKPEFSLFSWFAMLFAAGMGIGLLFYGVSEPVSHYQALGPVFDTYEAGLARHAMNLTFLHWGLHPWAIYALVALTLAWFHFSRGQPLNFTAALSGDEATGRHMLGGTIINVFAILGAVFGVATSLGLGVSQAASGIGWLTGLEPGNGLRLGLTVFVCIAAMLSVISGVGRGIRIISTVNICIASGLMLFVLVAGETILVLKAFGQHIGYYLNHFLEISAWQEAWTGTDWQAGWTIFYWIWWISWSPFVGMFIARISRGRTIREFVAGVLLAPTLFNFLWMTVFGSNALHNLMFGDASLAEAGATESLFAFLALLPWPEVTGTIAILTIMLFFITSADSGALVTSTLANDGDEPAKWQQAFWAMAVLVVTVALMQGGGLEALQAAVVLTGLPFAAVLLILGWCLVKSLRHSLPAERPAVHPVPPPRDARGPARQDGE